MAIDNEELQIEAPELKRTTFGSGLLKGLGITLRHMVSRSVTIQYPDEMDILPPRSRGVIALKTENCTVCMLCARECPDWCIYIEGHKESRQPVAEGKRAKKFNVLDRFAIDYALCMYCGICVEVCPYDALFWSPEFEYAEHDITELTHEMERLNDWMYKVLPPAALDEGAQGPALATGAAAPAVATVAPPAAPAAVAAPAAQSATPAPAPTTTTAPSGSDLDPDEVHKAVLADEMAKGTDPDVAEARAKAAAIRVGSEASSAPADQEDQKPTPASAIAAPKDEEGTPVTPSQEADLTQEAQEAIQAPEPTPQTSAGEATGTPASVEEAAEIRRQVLEQELAKGSDPRVAEARAKAAEMRALKGTSGPKHG